jgi:hypothetical protein
MTSMNCAGRLYGIFNRDIIFAAQAACFFTQMPCSDITEKGAGAQLVATLDGHNSSLPSFDVCKWQSFYPPDVVHRHPVAVSDIAPGGSNIVAGCTSGHIGCATVTFFSIGGGARMSLGDVR